MKLSFKMFYLELADVDVVELTRLFARLEEEHRETTRALQRLAFVIHTPSEREGHLAKKTLTQHRPGNQAVSRGTKQQ